MDTMLEAASVGFLAGVVLMVFLPTARARKRILVALASYFDILRRDATEGIPQADDESWTR